MKKANSKEIKVLYVDDEINNLVTFKANFRDEFTIFTAQSSQKGLALMEENEIQIVITDQYLTDMSGVDFLKAVMKKHPDSMRILLTGYAVIDDIIEAVNKTHIYAYINKPWESGRLKKVIHNAYGVYCKKLEQKNMLVHLQRTNEQLEFMLREKLVS